MPDFNLDHLKKTWQEQEVQPKYNSSEIESMLNKSSRNYVKFIFWISVVEFIGILGMNVYYNFIGNDSASFANILKRLGISYSEELNENLTALYIVLKVISLLMTGVFVFLFYQNYRKINVEANLKNFILQIIHFKKTVNLFILFNISLLVLFTMVLTGFTLYVLSQQHIHLEKSTMIGFITGIIVMTALSVLIIWLYYRIVYGIIMKRLGKNLNELKKIEETQ